MLQQTPIKNQQYRLFSTISMFFFMVMVILLLIYKKLVNIGGTSLPLTLFVSPLYFLLSDIIAEVYGFRLTRGLLYSSFALLGLFAFIMPLLINISPTLNVPATATNLSNPTDAYRIVFKDFFKLYSIFFVSTWVSDYINVWVISRWKLLIKGRYFWLRCLGASFIGITLFSTFSALLSPYLIDKKYIIEIIIMAIIIKTILLILLTYPTVLICRILKRIEKQAGLPAPFNESASTYGKGHN